MAFIKKHIKISILIILALIFFFIYAYLPISQLVWQHQNNAQNFDFKFNTPDEIINYYFAGHYAKTGELYYFEPLDEFMHRVIFPRWAYVIDGRITPGNFMGIDLIYGSLAKIFSKFSIAFFTPLFAIVGVLFFYLLIKEFFDKHTAFISAVLVFIFPGFWYYASRTMFHNILFLSFLIIGLYFLVKLFTQDRYKFWLALAMGLFFGLALITRTSEVVWVFLIVLMILGFYWRNLKKIWPYFLPALGIFIACFIPVLAHNKILYNNYFSTGYPLQTMAENLESGKINSINFIQALVLPFGFHPRVMLTYVFYNYILKLFWPWLILWLAGLIVFLRDVKIKKLSHKYLYLLLITYYLLIYYGSWFFHDALDKNLISLGSSYVRYFLPMFVFNLPMIAFLLARILQSKRIIFKSLSVLILLALGICSGYQVLYNSPESLAAVKSQLIKYQIQAQDLLKYIKKDDIILMDTGTDKILFPARKHLIVPQAGAEWSEIRAILPYQEVYYFHHTAEASQDYLNEVKFSPYGLKLDNGVLIDGGGMLYKIRLLNNF